jgi:hypothetical protein
MGNVSADIKENVQPLPDDFLSFFTQFSSKNGSRPPFVSEVASCHQDTERIN